MITSAIDIPLEPPASIPLAKPPTAAAIPDRARVCGRLAVGESQRAIRDDMGGKHRERQEDDTGKEREK